MLVAFVILAFLMSVVHTGSTPALFKTGSGVVLEGTFGPDGAFHSDNMVNSSYNGYRYEDVWLNK